MPPAEAPPARTVRCAVYTRKSTEEGLSQEFNSLDAQRDCAEAYILSQRPEGWTVRQVVHHLPDSHMNTYIRFRLALTEDEPTIKPYDQERWAALQDARTAPIGLSLTLFESLHSRWVLLLRSLRTQDFARTFRHPEIGVLTLEKYLSLVAWHGRHHIAHITSLRERMGWR